MSEWREPESEVDLKLRHMVEHAEADVYYHWRSMLSLSLVTWVLGVGVIIFLFAFARWYIPAVLIVILAGDLWGFWRFTRRMRRTLGCWPWRVGRDS